MEKHCVRDTLGAMAIIFGVEFVLSALVFGIFGSLIGLLTGTVQPTLYATTASWAAFNIWFWVSLVKIGKTNRKARVSDGEIIALQWVSFTFISFRALFSSVQQVQMYLTMGLLFQWCTVAFYVLYFLLALCVWVRLPLRSYLGFAVLVPLTIWQTMNV